MRETLLLFARARDNADRLAIVEDDASHTYGALLAAAERVATALSNTALGNTALGEGELAGRRVAFLVPPSLAWVATLWGIWRAGGVAVPLALQHPPPELAYTLDDAGAVAVVASPELASRVEPLARERDLPCLTTDDALAGPAAEPPAALEPDDPALIVYTSGTTGRPKGAVLTHDNLEAQVQSLAEAWAWSGDDRILEFLPLHHVHGIVNIVLSALSAGAVCEILPCFDAEDVWRRLAAGRTTLFMAVPTIYRRLITAWEAAPDARRRELSAAARRLRLMVSGSAALPVETLERWREITGHTLLERYGMTEIGMALGNPLEGERRPGSVGRPFPGVRARLVDERGRPVEDGVSGEIEIRGANVFSEYLGRPEATRDAFRDGWFRTGDMAVREADGYFRILGRSSVDILKTGGEKVSALEIEATLRQNDAVDDCAVVGVPHPDWGEEVAAAIVLTADASSDAFDVDDLRAWARERLAAYKVPRRFLAVAELPRNALGKVVKPRVKELFKS